MSAGKGDTPRRVDGGKYRREFDRIFRRGKNGTNRTNRAYGEDLSDVVVEFGSPEFYAGADAAMRQLGIGKKP